MHKDVGKRVMALLLSICMIAGMVDWSGFTVRAEGERYHLSKVEVITSYTYNGSQIKPGKADIKVIVQKYDESGQWRDSPKEELTSDMGSYNITGYGTNKNAVERSSVTVTGEGNIEGTGTGYFTIEQLDIGNVQYAEIGVGGTIYVTSPTTVEPSPVLTYEYETGRFLSLTSGDYTCTYENNKIQAGDTVQNATIKVVGKQNYKGTKDIPFKIHMLDTSKLSIELQAKASGTTLRPGTAEVSGNLPRANYTGKKIELDKSKDVIVKYENEVLDGNDFVLEYNSSNLISAGTVEVKARAINGKYAGITTGTGKSFMILKWLDDTDTGSPVQITIPDQSYPGKNETLIIPTDGSENSIKFVDPDAREEIKNKPISEKIDVEVPTGWEKLEANENGIIEWYAEVSAKNNSGYIGSITNVPFNIVAPSLSTLKITVNDREYDGTTKWLDEIEKKGNDIIKVGDGTEYLQDVDFIVKRKVSSDTGLGAGTYTIVITAKDGGKIRPGSVEKTFTVTPKSMLDSGKIQITVNSALEYNGSPHHPLPEVLFDGKKLTNDTDYTVSWENSTNATTSASKAKVKVTGKGNFKDTAEREFEIKPLRITEKISGSGNAVVNEPKQNVVHIYTGKDINPEVDIVVDLRQTDGTIVTEKLGLNDYTVSYRNTQGTDEHKNVANGTITMTISGAGNYVGDITRQFTIDKQTISADSVSIDLIPDQTYTGDTIKPKISRVEHELNGVLSEGNDYTVTYGDNTEAGTGAGVVYINGETNYKGTATFQFNITKCDIGTVTNLNAIADGRITGLTYDLINGNLEELYYPYDGKPKELPNLKLWLSDVGDSHKTVNMGVNRDYTVKYDTTQNVSIGTVDVTITGIGNNFQGTKKLQFRIKGNLTDMNPIGSGRTTVTIPDQIYNAGILNPKGVKVTFRLENGTVLELDEDDFDVQNKDQTTNPTTVGKDRIATITGKGDYYGGGDRYFNVIKLNLTTEKDNLETVHGYVISDIQDKSDPYIYSGLPIKPQPKIKHNGRDVVLTQDYTLGYYKNGVEITGDALGEPFQVGDYSVKINGTGDNYEGSTDKEYAIAKYDIGAAYSNVEPKNVADEVVLDDIKFAGDASPSDASRASSQLAEMGGTESTGKHEHTTGTTHSKDEVVWKDLKVVYKPKGIQEDTTDYPERELVYGVDYTVEYANNKTLGTATYTIKGKGNFTGEIKREFKILGDLSGERTKIKVDPCIFTPATGTEPANKTNVEVTYTHTVDGKVDTTSFVEGVDFILKFTNNAHATHPYPGKEEESTLDKDSDDGGWVVVEENVDGDGKHIGLGNGTNKDNPQKFKIYQRDISQYGEGTDLTLSGLMEEGYEYTGNAIIPDLQLACKAVNLTYEKLEEGQTLQGNPDYTITAKNNINVWTDSEETGPEDESKRVLPLYTVAARTEMRDGKALYNGDYCGTFSANFKITPRVVNQATVDTNPAIENERIDLYDIVEGEWVCDYDRAPHTFPKKENGIEGAEVPGKNGLVIRWTKGDITTILEEGTDYTVTYDDNTKIGKGIIQIGTPKKSNYQTEEAGVPYEKYFKIMASIEEVDRPVNAENPLELYMELKYDKNVPYDRPVTYPNLQFIDKSGVLPPGDNENGEPYILEKDKDFVIITQQNVTQYDDVDEYSTNNENVTKDGETATVVIRGIGYYKGVVKKEYKIIPKPMDDKGIVVQFLGSVDYENFKNAYIFNGNKQEPSYKVFNNNAKDIESMETETENPKYDPYQPGKEMKLGVDYKFVSWENNIGPSSEKGAAKLILEGIGNYTGKAEFEFNIVLRQMENLDCKVTGKAVYNGLEQKPEVEVSYRDENGKTVTLNPETDFDAVYTNNINAASKDAEQNPPTITLTGKGGYEGQTTVTFDIEARDINSEEITATGVALYDSGNPVVPRLTVKDAGVLLGTTLNPETDYKIVGQSEHVDVGQTGTVDIEGQGNYKGIRKGIEFRIIPPNGVLQIAEIPEQDFINQPIKPEVTVSLLAEGIETAVPLMPEDYDVTYSDNLKAGKATVTVTGKEPFSGTATAQFVIRPKSIGADGAIAAGITASDLGVSQYTGSALTPKVTLTFTPPQPAGKEGEDPSKPVELVQGRDYTVDYVNNVKVGVAKAVIKGIGNYTGSIEKEFEIHANMSMAKIEPIPMQNYTGSAVTPLPVVSLGGQTLALDKDYRVSYSNNVERGTATITITGIEPWYVGTRTVNFDIARELSEETPIRGVASVYTYTGSPITPPIRVEDGKTLLVAGVDYELAYQDNVDAGTATVSIKGIGKYTGSTSTTFQIMPQQLGRAKVSPISDQIFNGKEQNPPVTVTSGDKTLQNGKDYSLVYVNSATPGMASAIIKGEGNYTGTQTVNYRIKVPALTGVKFTKSTSSSVTISWTKNSVVTGYEIYNAKNRRALRVKKSSTTKGTVKKLKAGTAATFRVRAYVSKDGQYYYGPFTSVKTATAPSSTKISSLTSKKKKQVVVKWKKVKGATQYEVYRATSKKGKYKKIGTSKKTTYTDKKATGGKRYYYKVRVCKKINKKNYYSSYSAVKSVKAKK